MASDDNCSRECVYHWCAAVEVWEHGRVAGNGFWYIYCYDPKERAGATWFKRHAQKNMVQKALGWEMHNMVHNLGVEHVVQIVMDNGSNYKMHERHFVLIYCVPTMHGAQNQLYVKGVCARRISRWLYNHTKQHAMMKEDIGGELGKWNITFFDTNYMFLENFRKKRLELMQ
uniref:DUF659 domain-containing protein n=1 Tax=Oryza brachyantha TaxID=4533 RepID=J3KZY4_ORYBR